MINASQKVALVLGAGASCPYGFPLGPELYRAVVRGNVRTIVNQSSYGSKKDYDADLQEVESFRQELTHADSPSIDEFVRLRDHARYENYAKLSIAREILDAEQRKQHLLSSVNTPTKSGAQNELLARRAEGRWYQYLVRRILRADSLEEFAGNNIEVITFNYDRSLEEYLFRSLKSSFSCSDDEAAAAVRSIPIHHVYGSMGPLPWQCEAGLDAIPYGASVTRDDEDHGTRERAAASIDLVRASGLPKSTSRIREALQSADQVHFLGFAYDEMNLRVLETEKLENMSGTALGLSKEERTLAERDLWDWNSEKGYKEGYTLKYRDAERNPVDCLAYCRTVLINVAETRRYSSAELREDLVDHGVAPPGDNG